MVCALGEAWRTGGAARRGRGRRRRGRSRRGGRSGGTRPTPPTCRGCRRSPRRRTPSTTRTTSFADPVARASRVRFLWFDLRCRWSAPSLRVLPAGPPSSGPPSRSHRVSSVPLSTWNVYWSRNTLLHSPQLKKQNFHLNFFQFCYRFYKLKSDSPDFFIIF